MVERNRGEEKLQQTESHLRGLLGALTERTTQLALAEQSALAGSFAYDVGKDTLQISDGYAAIHGFPNESRDSIPSIFGSFAQEVRFAGSSRAPL
jgi:hypothetical protein